MNILQLQTFLEEHVALRNKENNQSIFLNDMLDYEIYNDIEELISDNSYLLKRNETVENIISNPISFNNFLNFLQSDNSIQFKDRKDSVIYIRAKNNGEANYYVKSIKDLKEHKLLNFLCQALNESDDIEKYELVRY